MRVSCLGNPKFLLFRLEFFVEVGLEIVDYPFFLARLDAVSAVRRADKMEGAGIWRELE